MTLVSETRDAVHQPSAQPLRPVAQPQATGTRAWPARVRRLAWGSIAVVGFFALWEFGPSFADPTSRVFLPPLHEVIQAEIKLTLNGQLATHIGASLFRAVIGFVIAVALGVFAGLLIAWYRPLRELLNPLLELFRNTAALALLPVFTLLLGIGEESKITIVVYAAFFPVLLNTVAGVRTVDPLLLTAARSLNIRGVDLFRKVILPSAVPTIFTGIRMAGTSSILVLIAAEMVGAKAGLGYLIINAQSSFLIPDMYAGILVVALLGLLTNTVLIALERRFSRWRSAANPQSI